MICFVVLGLLLTRFQRPARAKNTHYTSDKLPISALESLIGLLFSTAAVSTAAKTLFLGYIPKLSHRIFESPMNPVQLFKCLADETRLKSVLLIQLEQELCVCELVMALDEIQPKISRHLGQLKKAGILQDRKQSQWVYYRINDELPSWAKRLIEDTAKNNPLLLADGLANLQKMGNRPERIKACC